MNPIQVKRLAAKITSVGLIIISLFQIAVSFRDIFFLYPKLESVSGQELLIEEGLIEKALTIYVSMIVSGFYGVILLFKPSSKVKLIHVISGILIFIGSLFFIVETPFTSTPLQEFIHEILSTLVNLVFH